MSMKDNMRADNVNDTSSKNFHRDMSCTYLHSNGLFQLLKQKCKTCTLQKCVLFPGYTSKQL